MAIDTTKKIKQVTYNGTEIPLRGYDTSDATVTAGDMASGVIGYGASGKVTGNLTKVAQGTSQSISADEVKKISTEIYMHATFPVNVIFQAKSGLNIGAKPSEFGNATAADVAAGKTFTSAAGLKVTGTAAGSSAADVSFTLYNNGFANLVVVYMTKTDGVVEAAAMLNGNLSITTIEGSMVALIDPDFGGDTIDLVPDNGVHIAQGWRTANVTMFVAGAETNGMNIDVNIA